MKGVPLLGLHGTAVALAALGAAAPAGAAVIGPTNLADSSGAATCISPTCTVAAPKLPGATVKAPFGGKITRWKVNIPAAHDALVNDGPLRLQVLKRTVDQPGFENDEFVAVRETDEETSTPNSINSFAANLRIRKGQFIGLAGTDDTEVSQGTKSGAIFVRWGPALLPGDPASTPDDVYDDDYSLFNARVKR